MRSKIMTKTTFLKIAGGFATVGTVYGLWLRPWQLHWGATEEEVRMTLPGDELTPEPRAATVRAMNRRRALPLSAFAPSIKTDLRLSVSSMRQLLLVIAGCSILDGTI